MTDPGQLGTCDYPSHFYQKHEQMNNCVGWRPAPAPAPATAPPSEKHPCPRCGANMSLETEPHGRHWKCWGCAARIGAEPVPPATLGTPPPAKCTKCGHAESDHSESAIGSFCKSCPIDDNVWEHVFNEKPLPSAGTPGAGTQPPEWWIVQMSLSHCDKAFPTREAALKFQAESGSAIDAPPIRVQAALATPSAPNSEGIYKRALEAIEHAAKVCPQELTPLGATMKGIRARAENALANRE